mmetsp:Transcript_44467/g.100515  ORF Transcript_44467/g.100515 Transcript_44467/m.100515 type:complete len:209 (-) Transcript_44467:874-1500(-)
MWVVVRSAKGAGNLAGPKSELRRGGGIFVSWRRPTGLVPEMHPGFLEPADQGVSEAKGGRQNPARKAALDGVDFASVLKEAQRRLARHLRRLRVARIPARHRSCDPTGALGLSDEEELEAPLGPLFRARAFARLREPSLRSHGLPLLDRWRGFSHGARGRLVRHKEPLRVAELRPVPTAALVFLKERATSADRPRVELGHHERRRPEI